MAQDNPYLIDDNPYLKKQDDNPYLNIKPTVPQQTERPAKAPIAQPTGESTAAEIEAASKPAFTYAKPTSGKAEPLKKLQEEAEAARNAPKFTWEQLTKDDSLQTIQRDFVKTRTGKDVSKLSGEDLSKEFMSTMRADEWNTFNNIAFLNRIKNSSGDAQEKLALGRFVAERTKSALEEGGQPGVQPYIDMVGAALTDLTNYVGLGVGALMKRGVTKAATDVAIKGATTAATTSKIGQLTAKALTPTAGKAVATTTATEAVIGAGQDVVGQKAEIAASKVLAERKPELGVEVKELDYGQVGAAALFSSVFGFAEAKGQMALKPGKTGQEQLNELLQEKVKAPADPNAAPTKVERILTDPVQENMDKVVEEFMNIQGGRILDDINPATPLTDAKVQKDLSGRAVRVALYVMEQDPSFRVKPNQKTSTAIAEVFSNLDNIDDAVLEQAIRKEGLTPEEFAQANKLTVTEAAQVMQQYSAAAKAMARLSEIDPVFKEQADLLFGKPDEYTSALGRVGQMVSSLERESKAWVVSGIGTTVRNVIGTGVGLTYNSAASLIEGSLYTIGRTAKAAVDPAGSAMDTFKKGVGDTMRDAFGVYGHLLRSDLSAATTDKLLQHNPALRNNILSATQENATADISKAAKLFNSLNVVQDAFFRRAIFNASVEKHMRKLGLDMYEVVAEGKTIPASVLKEATDETLKATFSYTPKQQKKGIHSFESAAEGAGNLFVKAAEFPGGSLLATFPRFMSNAIAFQYRYSIFGAASGIEDIAQGAALKAAGSNAGDAMINKGMENFSKGVVGTAALAAAYDYRMNNQDTDAGSIKNADGSTTDVRAIFPLGPNLLLADFMVKQKLGIDVSFKDAQEALLGIKIPAGSQGYLIDKLVNAFSSEKDADSWNIAAGKVIGDFTARFAAPFVFKSAYEFFDLFREEGAVQRDPNVIMSEGMGDRFIESAVNRVQSKLPVLKEELPASVPRLREGPVYKEGEFFNSLIGVRKAPEKTVQEKEIMRLGIDPYKLFGPSSGDKLFDRAYVEAANPHVLKAIDTAMADSRYGKSPSENIKLIQNSVAKVTPLIRQITEAKMQASDYERAQKMRFNKMSELDRRLINEGYAKTHDGRTFEEDKAYRNLDEYRIRYIDTLSYAAGGLVPKFAGGGILGKTAAKAVGKAAADVVADPSLLLKKAALYAEEPVEKQSTSVFDQMSGVLQGKPAAKKAAPAPQKQPLATQTEEAIPAPTPKEEIAPTPDLVSAKPTKSISGYTDEDYAMGEKLMIESSPLSEAQLKSWKASDYGGYMSDVHVYTNMAKGVKWKDAPPSPFKSKVSLKDTDNIEYDIDGNEISVNGVAVKPEKGADEMLSTDFDDVFVEPSPAIGKGVASGDLESNVNWIDLDDSTMKDQVRYAKERTDVLAQLRKLRTDEFSKIRKDQSFDSFDDEVLAVLQGDFRKKFDREFSVATDKDVGIQMAQKYQQKLDYLREVYKDVPDKKLWHGNTPEKIAPVKKSGFAQPNKKKSYHEELYVGAPSFTSDLNLNIGNEGFGGAVGENILYTKIPYADYVFTRINMRPEAYDVRDLNTIAQSINGSSTVVRPVSLPRAGYYEKESMIPEPDKLNKKLKLSTEDINRSIDKGITQPEYNQQIKTMTKSIEKTLKSKDVKDAYSTYQSIRDTMNMLNAMTSNVSVKGGRGHQQAAKLNSFEKYRSNFNKIADVLERGGAKQKADMLRNFTDSLSKYESSYGTEAVEEAGRIKNLKGVFDAAEKLAKGGFVAKRR